MFLCLLSGLGVVLSFIGLGKKATSDKLGKSSTEGLGLKSEGA